MKLKLALVLGMMIAVICLAQPAMATSVADNDQVARVVNVPDVTSTLPLLGLGMLSLCLLKKQQLVR